jgi:putative ABC transport system substrate-binding protein
MIRRQFIMLLGAAASWPVAVRAQQNERMRRVGVLVGGAEDDPDIKAWLEGFRQGLESLGWMEDHNVRIEYRFAGGRIDRFQALARELIALQPDVILSQGTAITAALQRESRAVPIVFVTVSDPIGSGFIASRAPR